MKTFKSVNPYDNKIIGEHQAIENSVLKEKLGISEQAFLYWKNKPILHRINLIENLVTLLETSLDENARMISLEMGKPIRESKAEILKCAALCRYYAKNTGQFLSPKAIQSSAKSTYLRYDAMGAVLGIMPWNFPFWQVFRFAIPVIMSGNVVLLKHAPNVFGCAKNIEKLFLNAGFKIGIFQNLIVDHRAVKSIIANDAICGVAFTGSEKTGRIIGSLAGKYLKQSVLELGGSNAFMVFKDADIAKAAKLGVRARMLNTGQSCIAAKRFIVHQDVLEAFITEFTNELKQLKIGDPLDETTQLGVLARVDLAETLENQLNASLAMGARLMYGGKRANCLFEPSIVVNVNPGMPLFEEESFGPVAAFVAADSDEEVFALAEKSRFGLGCSICTKNIEKAQKMAEQSLQGAVFINEMVQSHPALPFGGTKNSGYGRELGKEGFLAFLNKKTVWLG